MSLTWILIIILVIAMVGGLPTWPYSTGWGTGYYPSGIILVIIVLLLLFGGGLR